MEKIAQKLENAISGAKIFTYETTDSTNTRAKEYAKATNSRAVNSKAANSKANSKAVFVADTQSGGRGRGEHSFHSPSGSGLYMTVLTCPKLRGEDVFVLTPLAAVAVNQAVELELGLVTEIKWVNDLYLRGKKVCGILAESTVVGGELYVALGVGINIYAPSGGFPPELEQAGALFGEAESRAKMQEARANLAKAVAERYLKLAVELEREPERTRKELYESYRARLTCIGREVEVIRGGEHYRALVRELDESFALELESEKGLERLTSGEISIKL